ncbi:MAG: histidine kinase [Reichenbachiella sp.]
MESPKLYTSTLILSLLTTFLLSNKSYCQKIDYDSIYHQIEVTNDEEDFRALREMVYFDESLADSTKTKLSFLAIERSEKLGLDYYYASFLYYKSMRLTIAGDYAKAILMTNECYQIFMRLEEFTEASSCYNNIGSMVASQGDTETGKIYLKKAIELNNLEKSDPSYDRIQGNHLIVYGNIFFNSGDLDSAFILTNQALNLAIEKDFLRAKIFCTVNLGKILKVEGKYPGAKAYLRRTLEAANETQMQTWKAGAYNHLADISIALDQFDSAIYFLNQGLIMCQNSDVFLPIQLDILEKKANLYAQHGMLQEAFELQQGHMILRDSFFTLEKETQLQWAQTEFDVQQKKRDIEALSQQSTIQALQIKQRDQALFSVLIFGLMILSIIYFILKSRSNKRKRLQAELNQRIRESELKALRSQMNPHFLFNAMNSIQEYIMSNERKLAGKYLGKFADLMRIYLEHSKVNTITLNEEVKALSIYLELEKVRFEDTLIYEITIQDTLNKEIQIPTLFIQPYVENAIKHGLLHKTGERKLSISIEKSDSNGSLICTVIDNGIGRKKSSEVNQMRNYGHKPFATEATKSRIELLNVDRKYPISEDIVDLVDENGEGIGTKVILNIPPSDEYVSESENDNSEVNAVV